MAKNEKDISLNTSPADAKTAPDATGVTSGAASSPDNEGLQEQYEAMHTQGPDAWFDPGELERNLILRMGQPWEDKKVLEIGCGEGELVKKMYIEGAERGKEFMEKTGMKEARNTASCPARQKK